MWQIIITFTVIFLCIMLIRLLFRGKISSRLQYALWLLVALRLMIPVSIQVGDMGEMRVPDLAKNIGRDSGAMMRQLGRNVTDTLSGAQGDAGIMRFILPDYPENGGSYDPNGTWIVSVGKIWFTWPEMVWYAGTFLVAIWIVVTNVIFYRGLRRHRRAYELPEQIVAGLPPELQRKFRKGKPVRTYVADGLTSPCLYGLPGRESVYLTLEVTEDAHRLVHVLTHELCHKKQGDSFWSLIRSILTACYWFHPLVWAAAVMSKRDCELACDEAAIFMLGEEERIPYGETLLSIITRKGRLSDVVCAATTMTGSSKSVKERIRLIAGRPKVLGVTMAAVLVFAAAILFFCFTKDTRMEGGRVLGPSEVTISGAEMQITLPASIGGISGNADEGGREDIIIYQVASGKEVGRFCKMDLKETLQLMDEGRRILPLGDYGYNYMLWDKLGVTRERKERKETGRRFFAEDVNVDELPESDCYIYLKADYGKVKDKYLEEMEFINGELEAAAGDAIVYEFSQEYRNQLYETLAEHKTLYIGNASEVGALVHALPTPEGLAYSDLSIDSKEKGKYTLRINYDMTAEYVNDIDSHMMFFDAVMLFASIGNMDECVFAVGNLDSEASWTYYRTELEKVFDSGLRHQDCEEDLFVNHMKLLYMDIAEYLAGKEEVSD